MALQTEISLGTQRLLESGIERRPERLLAREQIADGAFAVAFLIAAVAARAAGARRTRSSTPVLAAALVGAYALVGRAEFVLRRRLRGADAGRARADAAVAPDADGAAARGARARAHDVRGRAPRATSSRDRVLLSVADAWFAVAPALVLILGDAQTPDWGDWPVYVVAFAAQIALDSAVTVGARVDLPRRAPRDDPRRAADGSPRRLLLAPVGLLAAFAAAEQPYAVLLVVPLAGLFTIFAGERAARVEQTIELSGAYRGTALLLGDVIEADDEYTGQHTQDVVELTVTVADKLGVDDETRRAAEFGALLHDVGKVAIPNEIINKPGPLDDEEWAIMKTHTVEGQRMLERVGGLLARVGVVVRASHERYDGGGYPDGLAGEDIPLAARIVSACDAFNAMTTDRSYRKALSLEVAIAELRNNAGTQFDPTWSRRSSPSPTAEWRRCPAPDG